MAVLSEHLPIGNHHSVSSEVVPSPLIEGEGLTLPAVSIRKKDVQNLQENHSIRVNPPVGTVLYKLPELTRYLETPLEVGGSNFFDNITAEEKRIEGNSYEIGLRAWAHTWREFPGSIQHSPPHILENIKTWNEKHPKKPINIDFLYETGFSAEPVTIFQSSGSDVSFAADE